MRMCAPPMRPETPWPGSSSKSLRAESGRWPLAAGASPTAPPDRPADPAPLASYAATIARATGWFECRSMATASSENLVSRDVLGERLNDGERGPTGGERAGLVEGDGSNTGRCLEIRAALHQHAVATGARYRAYQRDRRRDHQGARARDHQQHERAPAPLREAAQPHQWRNDGDREREHHHRRRVPGTEAIDQLLHRRLGRLRLLDQLHHPRERRIPRRCGHLDVEQAAGVERTGEDARAGGLVGREWLAGDGGLVHRRDPRGDHAVERDALPRPHAHQRADRHGVERHHALGIADYATGCLRRKLHEVAYGAACAGERAGLEPHPEDVQEDDRRGLGVIARRESSGDRDQHERVDVEPATLERRPRARREQVHPNNTAITLAATPTAPGIAGATAA